MLWAGWESYSAHPTSAQGPVQRCPSRTLPALVLGWPGRRLLPEGPQARLPAPLAAVLGPLPSTGGVGGRGWGGLTPKIRIRRGRGEHTTLPTTSVPLQRPSHCLQRPETASQPLVRQPVTALATVPATPMFAAPSASSASHSLLAQMGAAARRGCRSQACSGPQGWI